MSKYQYGGYCPKCVQPVRESECCYRCGVRTAICCPHCGTARPVMPLRDGELFVQWPMASYRRVGFLWWARWEVKIDTEAKA